MERKDAIRNAYRMTGSGNFYDGMITCSTLHRREAPAGQRIFPLPLQSRRRNDENADRENRLRGIEKAHKQGHPYRKAGAADTAAPAFVRQAGGMSHTELQLKSLEKILGPI